MPFGAPARRGRLIASGGAIAARAIAARFEA
jgi:hypothetical protein